MPRGSLLLLVIVASPASALVRHQLTGRASPPILRLRGGLGGIDPLMALLDWERGAGAAEEWNWSALTPSMPLGGRIGPTVVEGSCCGQGVVDISAWSTMVAKVATGFLSTNSAFIALAPEKAGEVATHHIFFCIKCCSAAVS